MDRAYPEEAKRQHHPNGTVMEPPREEEKRAPKKYLEEGP